MRGSAHGMGRGARGSVSRVLSTPLPGMGDHSSRRAVARTLKQSTRTAGPEPALSCPEERTRAIPIRPCSRWGLPCRVRYRPRGALLPHPFTFRRAEAFGGLFSVALSLTPSRGPPDVIRHRGFRGARTFLPRAYARRRSPDPLAKRIIARMDGHYERLCGTAVWGGNLPRLLSSSRLGSGGWSAQGPHGNVKVQESSALCIAPMWASRRAERTRHASSWPRSQARPPSLLSTE